VAASVDQRGGVDVARRARSSADGAGRSNRIGPCANPPRLRSRCHGRSGPARDGRIARTLLISSIVASAWLMSVAVTGGRHPWIGWLALFPLFVALRIERPALAMGAGGLWGAVLWLCLMGRGAEGAGGPASPVLLVLAPALYASAGSWLTRRVGFSPFVLGVGWIGVELALRPLGLHHGLLASTQGEGWLFQIVGHVFGYLLVSFGVAFFTAWVVAVVLGLAGSLAARRPIPGGGAGLVECPGERLGSLGHQFAHCLQPRAPPMAGASRRLSS